MNNLFISYDLIAPGQHYDRVSTAIKELGDWARIHYSLFYVKSAFGSEEAANHVRAAMDANDTLIVIDASRNAATHFRVGPAAVQQMQALWSRP